MTRTWAINFFASLLSAVFVDALVIVLGGPVWAGFGFGIVVYHVVLPQGRK